MQNCRIAEVAQVLGDGNELPRLAGRYLSSGRRKQISVVEAGESGAVAGQFEDVPFGSQLQSDPLFLQPPVFATPFLCKLPQNASHFAA